MSRKGRLVRILGAAAALVGVGGAATQPAVAQGAQQHQTKQQPARPQQVENEATLSRALVRQFRAFAYKEPIWIGYPRQSGYRSGFPFKRVRGQRWS